MRLTTLPPLRRPLARGRGKRRGRGDFLATLRVLAWFTVDTSSCLGPGGFLERIPLFLREGGPWLLRSILAATCPHGCLQAQDAQHLGRYGPQGHLCRDTETASVGRFVRTWKPGFFYEPLVVFSACWFDSGYMFASFYGSLSYSAQCLDRQWIQICVSLRSSFVFQRYAWFNSGYIIMSVYRGLVCGSELQKTAEYPQLQFIDGRRFPVVVQKRIPMVMLLSRPQRLSCCFSTR